MAQDTRKFPETASQTAGPYVHIGCTPNFAEITGVYPDDPGGRLMLDGVSGEEITLTGSVIDGLGAPLRDAMIEIWQADANGIYPSPEDPRASDPKFLGWGRCPTDLETGMYQFETIKPGQVPAGEGRLQAPHISFWIVARGINIGLHTRMYFPEETDANGKDPILNRIEHQSRVSTLIARKDGTGVYSFDIVLQGPSETVFFDI